MALTLTGGGYFFVPAPKGGHVRFSFILVLQYPTMETGVIVVIGLIVLFILFRIFKAFLKWTIIILVITFIAAYFTNPDEATLRNDVQVKSKNLSLKKIRPKDMTIQDYKFFSLVKIAEGDEKRLIGIGAFGQVWYFDDLKEKVRKNNRHASLNWSP